MSCGVLRRLPKEAAWRKLLLAGTALTAVTTCTTGHAADWTGAVSTNWFDAGNWSTNAVPSGFEPAIINTTSPNAPLISGGSASSISGLIGNAVGSNGQVTVSGAGSQWTTDLTVGVNGRGTLNVLAGATVGSSSPIRLGSAIGSTGVINVNGSGSLLATGSDLQIGGLGSGELNVLNGGTVTSRFGSIGQFGSATGTATVSGAGSTWTIDQLLTLGSAPGSLGTLTIEAGGSVLVNQVLNGAFSIAIGNGPGGTGNLTVIGSGSALTTPGRIGVGYFGNGTLNMSNGGTVTADSVLLAQFAGTRGTLNIGAATGTAAVAPGTLNTRTVTSAAGTGQIVFNHTASNYTFAPLIAGATSVTVEAGSTNLTANNSYTGTTTLNGGTLLVNGSTASSQTTVHAAGTLGGSGTVGNTIINGGTLAPGNSIGALNVQGSLFLSSASTYLVEIDPNGADRTNVSGTATLGGATVRVSSVSGAGSIIRRYTILTAAGGVTGTFGTVSSPNYVAMLSYNPNNVFLDVRAALGNSSSLNLNQQAVANTINSFANTGGVLPAGFVNLFSLAGAGLANALTQISGETATGTQQTTFNAMDQFIGLMTDPFTGGRSGGRQGGLLSSFAEEAPATSSTRNGRNAAEREAYAKVLLKAAPLATIPERRWSVWGSGYGGTQKTDGNASLGSNDVASRIYGGAAGFDHRLSPDTLIGFSLGGAGTNYGLASGLGNGRSEMFQAGVYGRHMFGAAYLVSALAYGWQDVTTDRNVFGNVYRANFDASSFAGRLEGGYRFAFGTSGLTPYGAGQFTAFFLPGYAEQTVAGLNTFALGYNSKDVTASRTELGLRSDTSFVVQDAIVTLRGRAAWAHNFNTERSVGVVFQTLPGSTFVVNGAAQAHDSVLVGAGAEAKWLNGFSVAATFEGEFSNVTESYAGKGTLRYQW